MKLTKEQITLISEYLEWCGIKYIDIKFELIDHIATDIEELMSAEELSFDQALKKAMEKFYPLLCEEKSFHVGLIYTFPKIVIKKIEAKIKKAYLPVVISLAIFALFTFVIKIDFSVSERLNNFVNSISAIIGMCILLILISINYKSKPTTYRFLVNQSSPILLFLLFIYAFNSEMNLLKIYYLALVIVQFVFMVVNFINHNKCIKKYQTT